MSILPTSILAAALASWLFTFATLFAAAEPGAGETKNAGELKKLKVLSYNIHHGRGADEKIDLKRIAKLIKDSGADLVALQEVDKLTKRANGVDQAKELGRLTGMHAVFGKAIDFSGGEYGDALLSKYPIKAQKVIPLPTAAGKEDRVAVMIEVEVNGNKVSFVGTHLSHEKGSVDERLKAFAAIRTAVEKSGGAANAILAGDFNARPESKEIMSLREHWTLTGDKKSELTFPADKPKIRIDYICLNKGSVLKPFSFRVIEEVKASDHRPVEATFSLPKK